MQWSWMIQQCFYPTLQQAIAIGLSILCPCILLRLLVLVSGLQQRALNTIATILGIVILWWYYNTSVVYFVGLCVITYILLTYVNRGRGAVVSIVCVVYIFAWYVHFSTYFNHFCLLQFYFLVNVFLHQRRNGIESEVMH